MNDVRSGTPLPVDVPRLALVARQSSGWMRFLGVVSILQGALSALTIVGIVFCWLPIWLGILLFRASEDATFAAEGEPWRMDAYIQRLNRYFVIQGIVTLLGIVAGVIVFFAMGMAAITDMLT